MNNYQVGANRKESMNDKQLQPDLPVPLARLDLYNEAIIMTKFGHQSSTSYPVSIYYNAL